MSAAANGIPMTAEQRRVLVQEYARQGMSASSIEMNLRVRGVVNPATEQPYSISTVRNDLQVVSEIIGRTGYGYDIYSPWQSVRPTNHLDKTRTDYEFWDRARRGFALGFEFAGLFLQPIAQTVASFALGRGLTVELTDQRRRNATYTNDYLSRWYNAMAARLIRVVEDMYALGDQFVIVNLDGTISIPSPEQVYLEHDPANPRRVTLMRVTHHNHQSNVVIEDEYTPTLRRVRITNSNSEPFTYGNIIVPPNVQNLEFEFPNLLGRVPVIHFAADRSANEVYGRPIYEALYRLLLRYDRLLEKSLDGAEIMGNPIPVFENIESIDELERLYGADDQYTYNEYGERKSRFAIDLDTQSGLIVPTGTFRFASPGAFTGEIRNMLKMLFLLILDYTRIPEYMWGGEMGSARASTDNQETPFLTYIQGRRRELEGAREDEMLGLRASGGLYALFDLVLQVRSLTDPRIQRQPVTIKWARLTTADIQALLSSLQFLRSEQSISRVDTVQQLGSELGIENAEEMVARADEEDEQRADTRRDENRLNDEIDQRAAELGEDAEVGEDAA